MYQYDFAIIDYDTGLYQGLNNIQFSWCLQVLYHLGKSQQIFNILFDHWGHGSSLAKVIVITIAYFKGTDKLCQVKQCHEGSDQCQQFTVAVYNYLN